MPRSGTTLTGELLRRCRVEVFSECTLEQFMPLLKELHVGMHDVWRRIDAETHDERLCRVTYEIWRSLTASGRQVRNAQRFATKTPGGELSFADLDGLLEHSKPFYVYCVREPADIYSSLLHLKWGQWNTPKQILDRFLASFSRCLELGERAVVFDIDHASRDPDYRSAWTRGVAEALGVPVTRKSEQFLKEWPPINRWKKDRAGLLGQRVIARRIASFRKKAQRAGLDRLYQEVLDKSLEPARGHGV